MRRPREITLRELYLIPWLYVLVAFALGFLVPNFNYHFFPWLVSPLRADVVIAFLSSVSTGMITLTAIVFSLGLVLISFGSTAYSPRFVDAFMEKGLPRAIGVFTGTFVYTLVVLRAVGQRETGNISALILWVALAWLVWSIAALIGLVVSSVTITLTAVLKRLGKAAEREVTHVYHTPYAQHDNTVEFPAQPNQSIIYHGLPQYIMAFDIARLVTLAQTGDVIIRIPGGIGDAVLDGDVLALVYGSSVIPEQPLHHAIFLGSQRSIDEDPMYAMRLLVDMAIRALSPAVNDPTTAVQSLDQIEAILRRLGNSNLEIGHVADAAGTVRLVYAMPTWEDYLSLALLEILHYGADSVQVQRRLGALLYSVHAHVPQERKAAVERLVEERLATIQRTLPDSLYRTEAEALDRKGLGHAWCE